MTDSPTEHTEGLLRIGEVARLFNLSVGTLRHYEQMGLLDPAHIDSASGYRHYGSRQLSTLNTISHLRVLDLPLAQIREFVTTRDVDLMQRQLASNRSSSSASAASSNACRARSITDLGCCTMR